MIFWQLDHNIYNGKVQHNTQVWQSSGSRQIVLLLSSNSFTIIYQIVSFSFNCLNNSLIKRLLTLLTTFQIGCDLATCRNKPCWQSVVIETNFERWDIWAKLWETNLKIKSGIFGQHLFKRQKGGGIWEKSQSWKSWKVINWGKMTTGCLHPLLLFLLLSYAAGIFPASRNIISLLREILFSCFEEYHFSKHSISLYLWLHDYF